MKKIAKILIVIILITSLPNKDNSLLSVLGAPEENLTISGNDLETISNNDLFTVSDNDLGLFTRTTSQSSIVPITQSGETLVSGYYSLTDVSFINNVTSPITIAENAEVTIEVIGDNHLVSNANKQAGIYVPTGSKLTLVGDGVLTVQGGLCAAGIGGNESKACGDSTISMANSDTPHLIVHGGKWRSE